MSPLNKLREAFREALGVRVDNQKPARPDIEKVEGRIAINSVFDRDTQRQEIDYLLEQGGSRLETNDSSLGRDRGILHTIKDWLF